MVISGVEGDEPSERCVETVTKFFKQKMKMEIYDDEVITAYRLGAKVGKRYRPIIDWLKSSHRSRIFNYTQHLRGLKNDLNEFYYVNQQLPEQYAAEKKEIQHQLKKIKDKNKTLPADQQINAKIKNGTLLIDNVPQSKAVKVPPLSEVMSISSQEHEKMDQMQVESQFVGYAVKVSSLTEIRRANRSTFTPTLIMW